jgi:hypothetical protein
VLLTIGLKELFEKESMNCRFVSAEPIFKIAESKKEISPDIVLQYDNNRYGILCEIKTSCLHLTMGFSKG